MTYEVDELFPFREGAPRGKPIPRSLETVTDRYIAELAWQAWASRNPGEARFHRARPVDNQTPHWRDR